MNELIEWSAFFVGTVGTIFWATDRKWRGRKVEGWLWLLSALLWIWFAFNDRKYGLAARDLLGAGLYIMGIIKVFQDKAAIVPVPVAVIEQPVAHGGDCHICNGSGVHQLAGPGSAICACQTFL